MMKLSETNQLVGPLVLRYYMDLYGSVTFFGHPSCPKKSTLVMVYASPSQIPPISGSPTGFFDTRTCFLSTKFNGFPYHGPKLTNHGWSLRFRNSSKPYFFGLRGKRKKKLMFHDVLEKWGGTYLQSWFLCLRWFWSNNRSGGSFTPKMW